MGLYRQLFWKALEYGLLPDYLLRYKIHNALVGEIEELSAGGVEAQSQRMRKFLEDIRSMPIAINQADANKQHYEVPPEFYRIALGPRMKYSSCYFPEGNETLGEAENKMFELYCERAQLQDGMTMLDLGCGWGSLTLFLADRFPNSQILALSNSTGQKAYIHEEAQNRGFKNVNVYVGDISVFQREDFGEKFDRVLSIEMFEHMKNYEKLLKKISGWLKPQGKLFVHIFTHKIFAYHFTKGWMAKTFFTGGTMPSHELLVHFQDHVKLEDIWKVNGIHYAKTLDAWLQRFDQNQDTLRPIIESTYGQDNYIKWYIGWRMFFIICSETFAFNQGNEWNVSHYLFSKRQTMKQ